MRPRTVVLALIVLIPCLAAQAQTAGSGDWQGPFGIEVRVEDHRGRDLEGAEVTLLRLEGARIGPAPVRTDVDGRARIVGLAPGRWELSVRREGHMSYLAEVVVTAERPQIVTARHENVRGAIAPMRVRLTKGPASVAIAAPRPTPRAAEPVRPASPPRPAPTVTPTATALPAGPKPPSMAPAPVAASLPEVSPAPTPAPVQVTPSPARPASDSRAPASIPPTPSPTPAPAPPVAPPAVPPALAVPPAPPSPEPAPRSKPLPVSAPTPTPASPPAAEIAPAPKAPEAPSVPAAGIGPEVAVLRRQADRTCPECPPGEASLSIHRVVEGSGTGKGCAAEEVASFAALTPERWAEGAAKLPSSCGALLIDLPVGARYTGYRYEAAADGRFQDCPAGRDCPGLACAWAGDPLIVRTAGGTRLAAVFGNGAERARRARFTAYFREGKR